MNLIRYLFKNLNIWNVRKAVFLIRKDRSGKLLLQTLQTIKNALSSSATTWIPASTIDESRLGSLSQGKKVLVVGHIYYPEFVDRFVNAIERLDIENVTAVVTSPKQEILDLVFKKAKNQAVRTILSENRGRNFGPMLVELGSRVLDFDYLIHVHSKRSPHANKNMVKKWVDSQWQNLLENPLVVKRALAILDNSDEHSLYYPSTSQYMPNWGYAWLSNEQKALEWASTLSLRVDKGQIPYPAGGMFICKPKDLEKIFGHEFHYSDFPAERGQLDGELHHVLERAVGVLVLQAGRRHLVYESTLDAFTTDTSYAQIGFTNAPGSHLRGMQPNLEFVTFDFFDTLYRRRFQYPDMAKILVAEKYASLLKIGPEEFVETRNQVESDLRAQLRPGMDVKLSEVSAILGKNFGLSPDFLLKAEEEAEASIGRPRKEMVDLVWEYQKSGTKVAIVSDTYYSKQFLKTLGRQIGLPDNVEYIVSSELGLRKDRGDLWAFMKSRRIARREKHLHYGDNRHSDQQVPEGLGIRTQGVLSANQIWLSWGLEDFQPTVAEMLKPEIRLLSTIVSDVGER